MVKIDVKIFRMKNKKPIEKRHLKNKIKTPNSKSLSQKSKAEKPVT
jgi:hypothetical protein